MRSVTEVIQSPGAWGLTDMPGFVDPHWARHIEDLYVDNGNLRARAGFVNQTTGTDVVGTILRMAAGAVGTTDVVYATTSADIFSWSPGDVDAVARKGAVTVNNGYWQFAFLGGTVFALQASHALISTPAVGTNFSNVTAASGSVPDGDCIIAGAGRLWATVSGGQSIKYCALGDGTHWSTGAGSISLANVWTLGKDHIQGMAFHGGNLVVFGRNHVVIYTDGGGSVLGINPEQAYVADIIEGIGCVARDSIQEVGGDLIFVSSRGVESLGRLLVSKDNPLEPISWQYSGITTAISTSMQALTFTGPNRTMAAWSFPARKWYILHNSTLSDTFIFNLAYPSKDPKTGRMIIPITRFDHGSATNPGVYLAGAGSVYWADPFNGDIYLYDDDSITTSTEGIVAECIIGPCLLPLSAEYGQPSSSANLKAVMTTWAASSPGTYVFQLVIGGGNTYPVPFSETVNGSTYSLNRTLSPSSGNTRVLATPAGIDAGPSFCVSTHWHQYNATQVVAGSSLVDITIQYTLGKPPMWVDVDPNAGS